MQCSFCQLPNSLEFHSFLLLNIQTKNGDSEQGQSCDNPPGFEPSARPFFKHAVWWIIRAYINSQKASKRWLSTYNIIEVVKKGGKKERERGTETRIERDDMLQLYTEQEVQEKKRTVCIHTKETDGKGTRDDGIDVVKRRQERKKERGTVLNQKSQDDMPQHMERSFRTVHIPKKLAGTRDGERRKPPRQVEEEEDDDDDDDDEAGEAAAASAGQEPPAMVRIKLPHAITSAVQTSFQDFFSTIGLCYQSLSAKNSLLRKESGRAERERIAATTLCAVRALRCVGSVVSQGAKEGANGWSERAWGCAVDRARRNQMQPRVAFQCKDQWVVGVTGKCNLIQSLSPPPPSSFFSFFFLFFFGGDFFGFFLLLVEGEWVFMC